MKKLLAVATLVSMIMIVNPAIATVGPVKLDFGKWYKKVGASRANTANNFVVSFVYTKNIKIHDWVKVWLPLNESIPCKTKEELEKNICGGLLKITGGLESPRFVPNKAYFEKYPDSPEKDIGKLYYSSDMNKFDYSFMDVDEHNNPSWDACKIDTSSPKLIKDPSGLGYWMTGTVMPAIPRDKAKRLEFMKEKNHHFSFGDPCVCVDVPIEFNSNCRERSVSTVTPLEIEAWRNGYNPVGFAVTNKFGIIFPATPGRYRVAVATEPEPEPVESESFILPCSDVSNVSCDIPEFGFTKKNPFSITFRTGEGGALDAKKSNIFLKLPESLAMSPKLLKNQITVNGKQVNENPEITKVKGSNIIKIISPVDVDNISDVKVSFGLSTLATYNPGSDDSFVEVSTSSEPNFIKSGALWKLKESSIAIQPPEECYESTVSLRLLLEKGKVYPANSTIKITIPEGFSINKVITKNDVAVNRKNPYGDPRVSGNVIEIPSPAKIENQLVVSLLQACGVVNPFVGFYYFKLEIGADKYLFDNVYIEPAQARVENLSMSSIKPGALFNLKFDFRPSSFGALEEGDQITILFPPNFVMPASLPTDKITIDGKPVMKSGIDGRKLFFDSPVQQSVIKSSTYQIKIGIRLPDVLTGLESITLTTSKGDRFQIQIANP